MSQKWRVLLIEDSTDLQELLPKLLDSSDLFETTVTDSLTAGKEYLCQHSTDVVLLDLLLPDSPLSQDSLETMRLLQTCCPQVPVVVMTGDSTVTLEEVLEAGAQEYVAKPVLNRQLLQEMLLRAIYRHRVRWQYQPLNTALDKALGKVEVLKELQGG